MTTLITGGAGFVGLNIARELLQSGEKVVIFDLGQISPAAFVDFQCADGLLEVVCASVLSSSDLAQALRAHQIDRIVHGAAITASLEREKASAKEIVEVNTLGTINVLECAIAAGVSRTVCLGTGSVFGPTVSNQTGLLDETADLPQPETLYGISKFAAERIALRYRQTRGIDLTVARLGVVFGRYEHDTGLRDTMSAPLVLGQLALRSEHAKVYRHLPDDWVYATDVARVVKQLLDTKTPIGPLYQIATGAPWSVEDWCQRLANAFPDFTYELVDTQEAANVGRITPNRRPCFSIERLRNDIQYEPYFTAQRAFEDYVTWLETMA